MAVDRRQTLMGGAAGVLLIVAMWSLWPASTPAPSTISTGTTTAPRGTTANGRDTIAPLAPVKLADLTARRDEPGEAARNPFRFQPKAPPPPPPRPAVTAPVIEAPRVPAPPPGPPPPPPIPLKLIGVLERANGVKWAVLTDGKSGPMYGKDGDIIDGRYMIVKIGTESIEMTHADGRGRQVIRLTGQ
jgi:hypothetical protein